MDRIPQDLDEQAFARIYDYLLSQLDERTRVRVLETARAHPGLYTRQAGPGRWEMYLVADEDEIVVIGSFPERFFWQQAIQTAN